MGPFYVSARDANRRAIGMMFVCLSVCLGQVCVMVIVIIWCILAQIEVYGWIVKCSVHPDTKVCPPTPSRLFPVPCEREVGYG